MIADNATPPPVQSLRLQLDAGIATVELHRPQQLNALTPALMHELIAAAQWLAALPTLRIVVLAGSGRAFCAGFDLEAMRASRGGTDREATDLGRRLIAAWLAIPVPTLAAVQGHCVGGGVLLAAACDLRLAADDARFWIPEMALGIPLGWGGVPLLTRLLGPALAMELVLDCRPFDAPQALAWRFVNRVLPAAELDAAAQSWARQLAERPLQSLRTTKRRFAAVADMLCTLQG
ncbi:MAG: enoyl-CoA hydratase/isomerase family protein, partial [Aquabacterium sp.]